LEEAADEAYLNTEVVVIDGTHIKANANVKKFVEVEVTPGNVHDSVAFDDVYERLMENIPGIRTVVADSAYRTPHICKTGFFYGLRRSVDRLFFIVMLIGYALLLKN
jgi:hypothetical protein